MFWVEKKSKNEQLGGTIIWDSRVSIELLTLWSRGILKPSDERVIPQLKLTDITLTQCLSTPNFVGW